MSEAITKALQMALEALDVLLEVAMVPMTCEGLASEHSAAQWDSFSETRDFLRAALSQAGQGGQGEVWGWAIIDKNGFTRSDRPRFTDFFGDALEVEKTPDSAALRADEEWPGCAPHRVVTLYITPPEAVQPAPAVPAGWQLVPVEPTVGMLIAGMEHRISEEQPTHEHAIYAAMLSAAPKPAGTQ